MTINFGFSVKNYKCFKLRGASFYSIKPINLLVGRNNVGKSTFLEILDALCNAEGLSGTAFHEVELFETLEPDIFNGLNFDESYYEDEEPPPTISHDHLSGALVSYIQRPDQVRFKEVGCEVSDFEASVLATRYSNDDFRNKFEGFIADNAQILPKKHVRLLADRDIVPEYGEDDLEFTGNGVGATRIIHSLSHYSDSNRELVAKTLLESLNQIFRSDTQFVEITTKYHKVGGLWEIYLSEKDGRLYPLSQSGSGLKTIILVLLNLLVRPAIEDRSVKDYIFSFEELENNLHPTLQRKLFQYLEHFAVQHDCHIFITTHSNIAIDSYSNSPHAQINHIQKEAGEVVGTLVNSSVHSYGMIADLGNKASDLFQSNGLIWVEGPSDRVYLKKFIDIWSGGTLREGVHYQFAFFGGSLLSHLDMSPPEGTIDEVLSVLRINKNAVLVCDGDQRSESAPLKARVIKAVESLKMSGNYSWVTKCREIENYVPKEAFQKVNSLGEVEAIGSYESFVEYLQHYNVTRSPVYRDKVNNAELYAKEFTKENLSFREELDVEVTKICELIKGWNFM
ncbi:ATP-dependent endonuclease [Pseudomonas sp. BGI-2]|uniref:ATP-dependent nuclease n=1 Tax=Pseudomonas sp. BGI-2 TaxID=2528211 RepID=UPI0013F3C4FF|nr:AAA family ATPase [Pseudomonas sp. BGI-2]